MSSQSQEYSCNKCDAKFASAQELQSHKINAHN